MNRKSNVGGDEAGRNPKRRRRNDAAKSNNDESSSSRRRDLAEKTMGRDDGYGYYPSSDSDDDIRSFASGKDGIKGAKSSSSKSSSRRPQRRARKEQRLGMRSFRTANKNRDDVVDYDSSEVDDDWEDEKPSSVDAAAASSLPTPRGWTHLLKREKDSAIARRVKTPRPPSTANGSKSSDFTLSSYPARRASETTRNGLKTPRPPSTANGSKSSNFTLTSAPPGTTARGNNRTNNPYANSGGGRSALAAKAPAATSSATSSATKPRANHHLVCAVSENLARETCVASIDAGRPTYLHITKQGNGQTYAETMSLLRTIGPNEVLLNEGRRNSQLATKIAALFGQETGDGMDAPVVTAAAAKRKKKGGNNAAAKGRKSRSSNRGGGRGGDVDDDLTANLSSSECETTTVVKFVPRSYFDQTKGAEMLRKLAREDTYDASLVEEYILLSSSHAVLQYAQLCLGAGLTRGSLSLDVNVGGNNRMNIDRATMANLELLVNARTGRTANSLVGTIDCTKTSVGGRLLRTNLMAPPTRLDTINARLDLVDSLLEDEEFFYVVMEHLEDLPDVDKMLSYVALAPRKRWNDKGGNGALFGNTERQAVTARMASKGISALVCIKSTLSVIPNFAHCLWVQLRELDGRENRSSSGAGAASSASGRDLDGSKQRPQRERSERQDGDDDELRGDESTTVVESETSRNEDDSNTFGGTNDTVVGGSRTTTTQDSSLQIGLGMNPLNNNGGNVASVATHRQSRHQLLRAILIAMKQPALSRVLAAVTDIFTESTTYSKNSHAMRHQECFALKPNTDGMMDVLRKAFLANVDDIYRLADEYAETYDISVQVRETASRGYYLSVSADLGLDLPQLFIQPVKNGRFIHCTTEEVYSLNSRAQENVQDLLLMTHGRIQEVLQVARDNYDCIASLSDAIALLDMCHCFADNVASSRSSWCRPVLSDRGDRGQGDDFGGGGGGAIAIRNGRYAIDVSSTGVNSLTGELVPNDTYSSALQNFTVITGINGSGKSTYLKQIALIVILSHCGSYVPADEALLPIRDQICTRIGTADDQEHNISTFLLEMKETAFICNYTTDRSLFLLDELGRATSNEDGVAVAWSVSEYLLTKRAMTFFVTHYPQIAKLAEVYPNVQNQHLGSQISSSSNGDASSINYTHKIMPGPCKSAGDYGVEMAVTCGWPGEAVKNARRIRHEVKRKMPGEDVCYSESSKQHNEKFADNRRKSHNVLCDVAKHLAAMKEGEGRLSKEAKRNYLQELRDRLVPTNDESLVRMIRSLLLNVDDFIPMIPLTQLKPAVNVADVTRSEPEEDKETAIPNKEGEAMSSRTERGHEEDDASGGGKSQKKTATATTNQWSCDFSSSSSSDASSVSHMEEEKEEEERNMKPRNDSATSHVTPKINFLEKKAAARDRPQPKVTREEERSTKNEVESSAVPKMSLPENGASVGNQLHPAVPQEGVRLMEPQNRGGTSKLTSKMKEHDMPVCDQPQPKITPAEIARVQMPRDNLPKQVANVNLVVQKCPSENIAKSGSRGVVAGAMYAMRGRRSESETSNTSSSSSSEDGNSDSSSDTDSSSSSSDSSSSSSSSSMSS